MDIRALGEQLALNPMDPKDLLQTFGLVGVWAILFAETGLLVGFFFPGDSLLFLAGVAASPVANEIFGDGTQLSYTGLLIGAPICAILGAQLGHWLGARYGRRMFDKPDSRLFKREYVEKAEYYFEKFGPAKAVVLARFIPIVRTFLNPVAGTLGMPARKFFLWNVVGAILWTDGLIIIGHTLAEQIYNAIGDKIDRYILPVVLLIILISVLPILIEIIRERRAKKKAPATEPDAAAAIGVVAAASIAGLAESIRDESARDESGRDESGRDESGRDESGRDESARDEFEGQHHPQANQPPHGRPGPQGGPYGRQAAQAYAAAPDGAYGEPTRQAAYTQGPPYGQGTPYGQHPPQSPYAQDAAHGQQAASPTPHAQDSAYGQPTAGTPYGPQTSHEQGGHGRPTSADPYGQAYHGRPDRDAQQAPYDPHSPHRP